jgi:hypothetical protein
MVYLKTIFNLFTKMYFLYNHAGLICKIQFGWLYGLSWSNIRTNNSSSTTSLFKTDIEFQ